LIVAVVSTWMVARSKNLAAPKISGGAVGQADPNDKE
jgi:hypothetical protein